MVDIFSSNEFWFNAIFAFIDIFFGVMLWVVDSRSKRRQEETLQKQEESLDIILEQVSKVNHYQTRVLSYAIDTLEKDIVEMKKSIDAGIETRKAPEPETTPQPGATEPETVVTPSLGEAIGNHFSNILRNQLTGIMENVKKTVGDIKLTDDRESYKAKKGIEFDLKHVLRGLEELQELQDLDSIAKDLTDSEEKLKELKLKEQELKKSRRESAQDKTKVILERTPQIKGKEENRKEISDEAEELTAKEEISSDLEQEVVKTGIAVLSELGQDISAFTNSILESVAKSIPQDISEDIQIKLDDARRKLDEMTKKKAPQQKKHSDTEEEQQQR